MIYYGQELYHHGIKGQKWGVRRYQNEDGTLTTAGKSRYGKNSEAYTNTKNKYKNLKRNESESFRNARNSYQDASDATWDAKNRLKDYQNRHPVSAFVTKNGRNQNSENWKNYKDKRNKELEEKAKYRNEKEKRKNEIREAKQELKDVKQYRKNEINEAYKTINNNTPFGEKLIFSDGTRRAASKYVVDNNMSFSEAKKKANKEATRNTLMIIGGIAVGATAKKLFS